MTSGGVTHPRGAGVHLPLLGLVLLPLHRRGVCGPGGEWDRDRVAYRHGTDDGEVTLGGRRVAVERPRMRAKDATAKVPLASYEHFASRDALSAAVMERMLAGVSTRRYRRVGEPVGQKWR
jgi:putative transposase